MAKKQKLIDRLSKYANKLYDAQMRLQNLINKHERQNK